MNLNTLRNYVDSVPREVHLGILSGGCALAAFHVGGFRCKNWLCLNIHEEGKPFATTMMILHFVIYVVASRLQFEKTHHTPFYYWQMFKPLLLVILAYVDASHHTFHQALAWSYIYMSFLSSIFWCFVNRHEISAHFATRVIAVYVLVPQLYLAGGLLAYALTGNLVDADYYLTIVQTLFFYALVILNVFTLYTHLRPRAPAGAPAGPKPQPPEPKPETDSEEEPEPQPEPKPETDSEEEPEPLPEP